MNDSLDPRRIRIFDPQRRLFATSHTPKKTRRYNDPGTRPKRSRMAMKTWACHSGQLRPKAAWGSILAARRVQLALDPEPHLAEFIADVFAVGPGPVDGVVVEPGDD